MYTYFLIQHLHPEFATHCENEAGLYSISLSVPLSSGKGLEMVVIHVFYSSADMVILGYVENLSLLLESSINITMQGPIVVTVKVTLCVITSAIKYIFTLN
jgi:hypothetical protein